VNDEVMPYPLEFKGVGGMPYEIRHNGGYRHASIQSS